MIRTAAVRLLGPQAGWGSASWFPGVRCGQRALSSQVLDDALKKRIDEMVQKSPVVVFMKGVPAEPRCGFSNAVCQIFRMHEVTFEGHDVLSDEQLRQGKMSPAISTSFPILFPSFHSLIRSNLGIKEYSNWPTIPQVFFNGEFMGGCDIMIEMHQNGELIQELQKIGIKSALDTQS